MTKKRSPKKDLPIEHVQLPIQEATPLENLIADSVAMKQAFELASAGFSMSSIAATLSFPTTTFILWVKKGKALEEESPNAPEVILWKELSRGWATAKGLAEAKLAQVDPKFFLTRGPARLLGDDWDEDTSSQANKTKETLDVGADLITALKALREQGHDLNEIIDKNTLSIVVEHKDKPVDLLEKHGITDKQPVGLPGPFAKKTIELDNLLNLERVVNE